MTIVHRFINNLFHVKRYSAIYVPEYHFGMSHVNSNTPASKKPQEKGHVTIDLDTKFPDYVRTHTFEDKKEENNHGNPNGTVTASNASTPTSKGKVNVEQFNSLKRAFTKKNTTVANLQAIKEDSFEEPQNKDDDSLLYLDKLDEGKDTVTIKEKYQYNILDEVADVHPKEKSKPLIVDKKEEKEEMNDTLEFQRMKSGKEDLEDYIRKLEDSLNFDNSDEDNNKKNAKKRVSVDINSSGKDVKSEKNIIPALVTTGKVDSNKNLITTPLNVKKASDTPRMNKESFKDISPTNKAAKTSLPKDNEKDKKSASMPIIIKEIKKIDKAPKESIKAIDEIKTIKTNSISKAPSIMKINSSAKTSSGRVDQLGGNLYLKENIAAQEKRKEELNKRISDQKLNMWNLDKIKSGDGRKTHVNKIYFNFSLLNLEILIILTQPLVVLYQ